jgi:hypothetical protein
MSTISVLPQAAGQAGKAIRMEHKSAPVATVPADRRQSDQEMMYAWSIGITSVARTMGQMPRREECPPEVYIG